jgi:hypothetical protein
MVPPSDITMVPAARLIRAPAEMARLLTNAKQRVSDQHGGVNPPTEGVDFEDDRAGPG